MQGWFWTFQIMFGKSCVLLRKLVRKGCCEIRIADLCACYIGMGQDTLAFNKSKEAGTIIVQWDHGEA